MSINAISSAMSASVYLRDVNKLTDDIIEKLNNLGIDPNSVSSVSEANAAIKKAEESNQSDADSTDKNNGENQDLRDKVEDLADKIGVKVSENDTIDDIIDNISDVIDKMLAYAIDRNDKSLYDKYSDYKSDLNDIEADNNGGGYSGIRVFSFMEMIAEQNKYAHGIKSN